MTTKINTKLLYHSVIHCNVKPQCNLITVCSVGVNSDMYCLQLAFASIEGQGSDLKEMLPKAITPALVGGLNPTQCPTTIPHS